MSSLFPIKHEEAGPVFSYMLRYIVGFWLVEMTISTNQKPTIYRNLYDNTGRELYIHSSTQGPVFLYQHSVMYQQGPRITIYVFISDYF